MCGVAAVVINSDQGNSQNYIEKILNAQNHRGPDGKAIWNDPSNNISLGHNRLAIIETSEIGAQPWINEAKNIIISWNGEIYNYIELRNELQKLGANFRTKTDSEVLSIGYEYWGSDIFSKLRGMFAILIYDLRSKIFLVARDRIGIKPLYYSKFENSISFASETRSLRQINKQLNQVNQKMVDRFLNNGTVVHKSETFYKNIFSVEPGNYGLVNLDSNEITFHNYWTLMKPPKKYLRLSSSELRDEVLRSVRIHLRSDVPVCTSLSGGIDSSIITSITAKSLGAKSLSTFSVHWPANPEIDESLWINEMVEFANIENDKTTIAKEDFEGLIDEVLIAQDEPFASSTVLAQYVLYKAIRAANYSVVLDGQGADELFIGYQGFIPILLRFQLRKLKLKQFCLNLISIYIFRDEMNIKKDWILGTMKIILAPKNLIKRLGSFTDFNSLDGMRFNLLLGGNLQSLLKYQDRNSMAFSVESRVPFLDHVLVEKIFITDPAQTLIYGRMKNQLRFAFINYLPKQISRRRSKFGYTTPETAWLESIGVRTPKLGSKIGSRPWREYILSKWIAMVDANE